MPEKPSFLDKPEERKMTEEEQEEKKKKLYVTGSGQVISEREKKDMADRDPREMK